MNAPEDLLPGYTTDLFVSRHPEVESYVVGGTSPELRRWCETLNSRTARSLWFDLTRLLFPERAKQVLSQVSTMVIPRVDLNAAEVPAPKLAIRSVSDGGYVLSNWIEDDSRVVRLNPADVQKFWAALDIALYPAGW
jgi:hypothetical protein